MSERAPWLAALFVVVVIAVVFGWAWAWVWEDGDFTDDSDCTVESSHDERAPGCQEICQRALVWYGVHHERCYWDDVNQTGGNQGGPQ